jgi:hypothetical protein
VRGPATPRALGPALTAGLSFSVGDYRVDFAESFGFAGCESHVTRKTVQAAIAYSLVLWAIVIVGLWLLL